MAQNPTVNNDCSSIQVGYRYCIEVNNGFPCNKDLPKAITTKDTEPEPTIDSKPSPTQDSLIGIYMSFYKAKKGDIYTKIITQYQTFNFNAFLEWNPAVKKDCSGIWADIYYCVGVLGIPTAKPTLTTVKLIVTGGIKILLPI